MIRSRPSTFPGTVSSQDSLEQQGTATIIRKGRRRYKIPYVSNACCSGGPQSVVWRCTFMLMVFVASFYVFIVQEEDYSQLSQRRGEEINRGPTRQKQKASTIIRSRTTNTDSQQQTTREDNTVVDALLKLVRMPSEQLQTLLETEDYFQLELLKQGQCPNNMQQQQPPPEWLPEPPPLPLNPAQEWFSSDNNNNNNLKVVVYYEHLSKAGGTSFCKLAQSNFPKRFVPSYYCMPSEPNMPDARVGSWTPTKLQEYIRSHPHKLLSNEWEPFNLQFLQQFHIHSSSSQLQSQSQSQSQSKQEQRLLSTNDVRLVLITSIRNPINRLYSAYKFWGHLHNGAEVKPDFDSWLIRYGQRAKNWKIADPDFVANVGRFNFATWKFSGGTLPVSGLQIHATRYLKGTYAKKDEDDKEDIWFQSFVTAVDTLSKFDLIIPMELLSDHTEPLTHLLGWTKFDKSHVVPSGQILNNDASHILDPEQYKLLWHANKLDIVLYYWTSAIYLTRLYCK